jgi:ADP-ribose pyrophosphatase
MRFHNFIHDKDGWKLTGNEILFANPHLEVHKVTVISPTRKEPFHWTVTHRKAAVVIAPRTVDGKFLLVRQERVPIRATIWEFPAGQIDDADSADAIRSTCQRELHEEAGYELAPHGEFRSLGYFFPSCGFTDEHSHLLLASPVVPVQGGARPESSEAITECRAFSPDELHNMIASGEIRDANTLAAFARMVAMGVI